MLTCWIFLAEDNEISKLEKSKYRRHSSQQTAAILKIGEATALPVMLYHHWIQIQEQEPSQSDDDEPMQQFPSTTLNSNDARNNDEESDQTKPINIAKPKLGTWKTKKHSSEDNNVLVIPR